LAATEFLDFHPQPADDPQGVGVGQGIFLDYDPARQQSPRQFRGQGKLVQPHNRYQSRLGNQIRYRRVHRDGFYTKNFHRSAWFPAAKPASPGISLEP
jgi:hypothetical protein